MLRSGTSGVPLPEQPVIPPIFALRQEWTLPDSRLLCLLVPVGQTVEAFINAAHGMAGFLHAAYHAERGIDGPFACHLGDDCGYDAGVERGPECAPSRSALLGRRQPARNGC